MGLALRLKEAPGDARFEVTHDGIRLAAAEHAATGGDSERDGE
jgi:hypothetical protein